jgi:hypothetical protein
VMDHVSRLERYSYVMPELMHDSKRRLNHSIISDLSSIVSLPFDIKLLV